MSSTLRSFIPVSAAAILLCCAGCGSHWLSLEVDTINYYDLYSLTKHTICNEGYKIADFDMHEGTIDSDWNYDKMTDVGRFPIRRMVEAKIDPHEEGGFLVSIRIDQEANREGYRLMTPELSDGWEEYGWDKEAASLILKKLELQVGEFKPSDDFYERYRKADRLKSETDVPDSLK